MRSHTQAHTHAISLLLPPSRSLFPSRSLARSLALSLAQVRRGRAAPLVADKICTLLRRPWGQTNKVLQNECISAAKDILRKFPPLSAILLPVLTDSLSTVEPNTPAQVRGVRAVAVCRSL